MKQILQDIIPKSKGVTDVLEASLYACKKCLLLDIQKQFDAAQPDMGRKRFAYSVYDERKRSLLVNMKKFLKMFLNMPVPGDKEINGKPFILLPVAILIEILRILKDFSDTVSASLNSNYLSSKIEYSVAPTIIHHLMKKQQNHSSTFTKEFSDNSEQYSAQSEVHTRIQPDSSVWSHVMSPNCNVRNFSCKTEVLQPGRKRSSRFALELDTEFAHLPKAALEFLSYSSTSCPSNMNEPLIHQVDPHILNSLPVQPSWLPYQPREPLGGCPTQLWPHANPARIWPRILLMAKCVCDGLRCALHGTHRCITVKVAVVSLIRDTRDGRDHIRNVRRRMEMVAVGCVCAEQKSVLVNEHRPPILE